MKKLVSFILTIIITGSMAVSAFAAGSYSLKIFANGKESAKVPIGGKVKVALQLSKDEAESIDLYSMQDYMCFDTEYLRFVDDSIKIYELDEAPLPNTRAEAIKFNSSNIDYENRVYFNRGALESVVIPDETVLVTFKLEAQKAGTTTITHDAIEIFQSVGNLEPVTSSDATIIISSDIVQKYPVNVPAEIDGGTAEADKTEAEPGDDVTITVTPDSGKQISSVTVKDASGESIDVTINKDGTYTFLIPDSEVTVDITFEEIPPAEYSITLNFGEGGNASVSASQAIQGDEITITATPNERYEVDKITYTPEGGTATDITDTKSFTMPECDVSVEVTFKHKYLIGDINVDGKVNAKDKAILNRYLAGWKDYDKQIKDWDAADINRDEKINAKDKAILNRYLAGWKGYDKYFDDGYIYS